MPRKQKLTRGSETKVNDPRKQKLTTLANKSLTSVIGINNTENNTENIDVPEIKKSEINYLDRPNPKTDTELTEKLVTYLEDKNDISQEARRGVFEQMAKTCKKLRGKGLTQPQALKEVITWFAMKYFAKNKALSITYSAFVAALKAEIYYYDHQQPDIVIVPTKPKMSVDERMKLEGYA